MDGSESAVIYSGWAWAAVAYALLSLRLVQQEYLKKPVNRIAMAMLAAALLSVAWSGFSFLALTVNAAWWLGAQSADI